MHMNGCARFKTFGESSRSIMRATVYCESQLDKIHRCEFGEPMR